MNYNETTGEVIKRSIYDEIRRSFRNKALNWNGVWKVWSGKGPDWGGRWVGGWKGMAIAMHDTIPLNVRDTKRKTYSGLPGEVNQDISVESNLIHTLGNENNIRRSMRNLNTQLATNFKLSEYGTTSTYQRRRIKSYKVLYREYNTANDIVNETVYWTDSYQTFKEDDEVKLYSDQNLTNLVGNFIIISYESNPYKKFVVEWTGDRYYVNETISSVDGKLAGESESEMVYDKPYNSPTNINSNNSNSLNVYCRELGNNTYRLFRNDASVIDFGRYPSASNPVIITFNIGNYIILKSYLMRADNRRYDWETPCDWTIQASNDNNRWTVIDTHLNEDNNWGQNRTRTFNINNNTPYLYYRLVVTRARRTDGDTMELGGFTFYGLTGDLKINVTQPNYIGVETSENLSARGIKKYSELKPNPNDVQNGQQLLDNPAKTSETIYEYMPDSIEANQKNTFTFDVNRNYSLNNEEVVKKADYQQLEQLLDKMDRCLKLRDGWFDSNDRCIYTCQVACQNRCQVSCQACNTKQCHDQKCGTH